jgi:hypothetical protein
LILDIVLINNRNGSKKTNCSSYWYDKLEKLISHQSFLILLIGVGPGLGASLAKRYDFISNI